MSIYLGTWTKLAAPIVLGVFFVAWALAPVLTGDASRRRTIKETPERKYLVHQLDEIHRTWQPQRRAEKLDALVAEVSERGLVPPLRWLLHLKDHVLVEEGLELARRARDPELVPELRELFESGPERYRGKALVAAQACGGVEVDELLSVLREGDVATQVIALQVARHCEDFPWEVLIERFASPHEEVREAALVALPEDLPEKGLARLATLMAEGTNEQVGDLARRALASRQVTVAVESAIAELLSDELLDPAVVARALDVLAGRSEPLGPAAGVVWRLATDSMAEPMLQASAWRALEVTDTEPVGAMPGVPDLILQRREVRLFAGRYLLSREMYSEGAKVLVEVLPQDGDPTDDFAVCAKRILGIASGIGLGGKRNEFERWAWSLGDDDGPNAETHYLPELDGTLLSSLAAR